MENQQLDVSTLVGVDDKKGGTGAKKNDNNYATHKNALSLYIDGGGVASVIAILRPRAFRKQDPNAAAIINKESPGVVLEGRLLVFETKNVDVVKKIAWRAVVCASHEEYMGLVLSEPQLFGDDECEEEQHESEENEPVEQEVNSGSMSPLPHTKGDCTTPPNTPWANSPVDAPVHLLQPNPMAISPRSPPPSPSFRNQADKVRPRRLVQVACDSPHVCIYAWQLDLEINPAKINFGEVKISHQITSKLTLHNPTEEDIPYKLATFRHQKDEASPTLSPASLHTGLCN